MAEMAALSQVKSVNRYRIDKGITINTSTNSLASGGQSRSERVPVVLPQEYPRQTMCRIFQCREQELESNGNYRTMRDFLLSYQRSGGGKRWDEFRNKIPAPLLAAWGNICIECGRNGFMAPVATADRILWHQVTAAHGESSDDLCLLCERPCNRRAIMESGRIKEISHAKEGEPKKCWEVTGR